MAPATDFQKKIADLLDAKLLDWLENGKEDDNGARRDLTAAEVQCIIKRLSQLGVSAVPVSGSAAGNLVEAAKTHLGGLKFHGRVLPPVDTEGDDAATGT